MIDVARAYQEEGWAVFPVNGKVPATTHGVKDASTENRLLRIWYERHPGRGVALATGQPSGVWALDLDGEAGRERFRELQAKHGKVPETVASRTGSGFHLLWRMPTNQDIRNSASQVAEKVDVRGTGGYIVLPPSPHPNGSKYRWVEGRSPADVDVANPPRWLLDLVTTATAIAPSGERVEVPDIIPEGGGPFGGRDEALFRIGCSLRAKGLSLDAIHAALSIENRDRCRPPLPDNVVRRKAEQAAQYEPGGLSPNGGNTEKSAVVTEDVTATILADISERKQQPIDAVPTPWPKWGGACFGAGGGVGLARGWHVVIGAASGSGKSLAATNLAATAIRNGYDTVLLSLEMTRDENITRLLSVLTARYPKRSWDIRGLEHGSDFDPAAWEQAGDRLLEMPGRFTTNPGKMATLPQIETAIRTEVDRGARLVIVDYLQLAWVHSAESLYQQITEVSHVIQGLAKELDITTVGISQVNRRTSSGDQALQKEGLMGGSPLENDAEQVVLIGKPEKQYDRYRSTVRLDKNRHGPQRDWAVIMDPKTLRMEEEVEV